MDVDNRLRNAFEAWNASHESRHVKLVPSSFSVSHDSSDTTCFTARSQYELPDGGRFHLIVSGNTTSASDGYSSLTAMVEDGLGLPDGFLMDINNYLFGDLPESAAAKSLDSLISAILRHACKLYDKLAVDVRPIAQEAPPADNRDIQPEVASKRKRNAFNYSEPRFGQSRVATTTLMKQLSILRSMDTRKDGFVAEPLEDNLYIWTVRLYFDDKDSCKLAVDLHRLPSQDFVQLEFRFPMEYPNVPPIVRVVAPFINGGHVAPHGGLCMELLTTSGWAPVNSIDAVCIQIRTMLLHGNARVDFNHLSSVRNYTLEGALSDMRNIVRIHRWDTADSRNSRRKILKS